MQMLAWHPARKAPLLAGGGTAPFLHINDPVSPLNNLPGAFLQPQQMLINGTTVFSGEPESDLTCNASGSRKRALLDGGVARTTLQHDIQLQQQRQWKKSRLAYVPREDAAPVLTQGGSSFQPSHDEIRTNESGRASTSGRPPAEAPLPAVMGPVDLPLMEELVSHLCQQSFEVETFIRLQNERIRSGLEDARKRHHQALLSAMEQGALRRLREIDAVLESAGRCNADLEEKIRLLAAENQIWFNVARNNEAIVSSLRATLDQVLLHNTTAGTTAVFPPQPPDPQEGFGESGCAAPTFPADDVQSCCYEGAPAAEAEHDTAAATELRLRSACKACLKREAAVLLLPCRHVCLCEECDSGAAACPVCNAAKNASLHVFMC